MTSMHAVPQPLISTDVFNFLWVFVMLNIPSSKLTFAALIGLTNNIGSSFKLLLPMRLGLGKCDPTIIVYCD